MHSRVPWKVVSVNWNPDHPKYLDHCLVEVCAKTWGSKKVLSSGESKGGLKDLEKITSKFREKGEFL